MTTPLVAQASPAARLTPPALLRLLQLSSSGLPTGAFAYSQGLESMLDRGLITDEAAGSACLDSLLHHGVARLDLPILLRSYAAWQQGAPDQARYWSARLLAARESGELQAQDRQLARALARILCQLVSPDLEGWVPITYVETYARACVLFRIPLQAASAAHAYVWCEQHVSALARLLPLGPAAAQRVLNGLIEGIPEALDSAAAVTDDAVGASTPMLALASAWHETQHSRLFRS